MENQKPNSPPLDPLFRRAARAKSALRRDRPRARCLFWPCAARGGGTNRKRKAMGSLPICSRIENGLCLRLHALAARRSDAPLQRNAHTGKPHLGQGASLSPPRHVAVSQRPPSQTLPLEGPMPETLFVSVY